MVEPVRKSVASDEWDGKAEGICDVCWRGFEVCDFRENAEAEGRVKYPGLAAIVLALAFASGCRREVPPPPPPPPPPAPASSLAPGGSPATGIEMRLGSARRPAGARLPRLAVGTPRTYAVPLPEILF